jgi:uncharacterized RDD family membrane protein YckC
MSTATLEQLLEFRCTSCWHSNCVSCQLSGQTVQCCSCGVEQEVPEATPQRIARAAELATGSAANFTRDLVPYEQMSEHELQKLVQQECYVPSSQMDYSGAPLASAVVRLFAQMIDGFLNVIAIVLGWILVIGLSSIGLIHLENSESPGDMLAMFAALSFPFLVFVMVQWNLIATRGQTLGKMLLCIRIINALGNPPGFIQGVILRNWLRAALSMIPLFGLIDIAFILTESKRCLHDYFAGTRVVQA